MWKLVLSLGILFLMSFSAYGKENFQATAGEMKILPPYCTIKWTYGNDRGNAAVQHWMKVLGPDYMHIHHYCTALNFVNRANLSWNDAVKQRFQLSTARNNFEYIAQRMKPTMIIKPEIHVNLGKLYQRMKQSGQAVGQYQMAIASNRKYTPAYAAMSDYYKDLNNREEALKIVKQGLLASPKSKSLKRRLKKLEKGE